jgi:hypothetical protein
VKPHDTVHRGIEGVEVEVGAARRRRELHIHALSEENGAAVENPRYRESVEAAVLDFIADAKPYGLPFQGQNERPGDARARLRAAEGPHVNHGPVHHLRVHFLHGQFDETGVGIGHGLARAQEGRKADPAHRERGNPAGTELDKIASLHLVLL